MIGRFCREGEGVRMNPYGSCPACGNSLPPPDSSGHTCPPMSFSSRECLTHCFCRENTAGHRLCCRCGWILPQFVLDTLLRDAGMLEHRPEGKQIGVIRSHRLEGQPIGEPYA